MEALFLKIVNMSITASYVIIAVILAGLLLKKAPKKYRYGLWSAAFFRLICPVSFSMVFSLFQSSLFNMARAQADGPGRLTYVPGDIGTMHTPQVTVGISSMNRVISDHLPQPTPYASVNPLQIYLALAALIWLTGIAIILIYNITRYILLKKRISTAVRVEPGVYEADGIQSPFILGFFRPRIYLPFGLTGQQRSDVLCHERVHLKRKDHWIKPAAFLVRTVHWFNPLVWLAYLIMVRDMEMSCDEWVLFRQPGATAKAYSLSLLSFAENRRLPGEGALAFGERSIGGRIKNALGFRRPRRWVSFAAMALMLVVIVGCAANPVPQEQRGEIKGRYQFEKLIFNWPARSFQPDEHYVEYYTLTERNMIIMDVAGGQRVQALAYEERPIDPEEFIAQFTTELNVPDISGYKERLLLAESQAEDGWSYRLYRMDDALWLAQHAAGDTGVFAIYQIKAMADDYRFFQSLHGSNSQVEQVKPMIEAIHTVYEQEPDLLYNITFDSVAEAGYSIFKYGASGASFLMADEKIYPLGSFFGGYGVTSMAAADMDGDGKKELYFTFSWGSGIHRSQAGYFQPATGEVILFPYSHMNQDMMIVGDGKGGLALYDAQTVTREEADTVRDVLFMVDFDLVSGEYLTQVAYDGGQIALTPIPQK